MKQDAYDLFGLTPDAPREAIVRAYHELLLRHSRALEPHRFAEIERAYNRLTSLEQCMREALYYPEDTLRILFAPPAMTHQPEDEPEPPAPLDAQDLEALLGPWRRKLVRLLLRN